jgi:adenylate cyclase
MHRVIPMLHSVSRINRHVTVGLLFIGTLLSPSGISAQSSKKDSLLKLLNDASRPDTTRLSVLSKLKNYYIYSNTDSAFLFSDMEFGLAEKLNNDWHMASARITLGWLESSRGDHAKSIGHFMAVLKLKPGAARSRWEADATTGLGNEHYFLGDMELAEKYYKEGLQLHEKMGDRTGIALALNNLANAYAEMGKEAEAIAHYKQSYAMREQANNLQGMGMCLNNIAYIFADQGLALIREGNAKAGRDIQDSAIFYFKKSIDLYEKVNDVQGVSGSWCNIASVYQDRGESAKAIPFFKKGLEIAIAANLALEKKECAGGLYKAYRQLGKKAEALDMYELYIQTRDSINSENNNRAAMKQQYQFEYEKKEVLLKAEQEKRDALAQAELRRKELQRNASFGGLGLMMLLAGVFLVQRNRISKEKARSEELLLNILPEEVAEELKLHGEAVARQIDEVTVLFTDFKGFTAMSEKLSPKELVRDLHECFSAFDRICQKHGLEKIKTIGDAYMAAGGLPTPNTTHAHDVVKAALEMAAFVAEGKARKQAAGQPFFEVRIGIHTGPVVAGIVGVKKFQYDIWGDTVNTASRMESSGEVGKVNISEATYALVQDQFTFEYRGEIEAKGKGKLGMWFVEKTLV